MQLPGHAVNNDLSIIVYRYKDLQKDKCVLEVTKSGIKYNDFIYLSGSIKQKICDPFCAGDEECLCGFFNDGTDGHKPPSTPPPSPPHQLPIIPPHQIIWYEHSISDDPFKVRCNFSTTIKTT